MGADPGWDKTISEALNGVRALVRTGVSAPSVVYDARALLDAQRLFKDEHEIAMMRRAGEISSLAHIRAMERARPGQYEYQVEAELLHEFVRFGAREQAYSAIVASGANACVLHYRENNRKMADGDLLLIDAGCEYASYASDITRTFPVNGKFTGPQKAVYEVVLEAQQQCIDQVKPGQPFNAYHDTAVNVLAQGLIDLGLCKGSLDAVIETKAYSQFYMHRAGHWLGLDVHDAGDYRVGGSAGQWQTLKAGMVLTVEPGLYIRPAENVPEQFHNIGVRIEDDILITAAGNENLTAMTPKSVADVEAACRRRAPSPPQPIAGNSLTGPRACSRHSDRRRRSGRRHPGAGVARFRLHVSRARRSRQRRAGRRRSDAGAGAQRAPDLRAHRRVGTIGQRHAHQHHRYFAKGRLRHHAVDRARGRRPGVGIRGPLRRIAGSAR